MVSELLTTRCNTTDLENREPVYPKCRTSRGAPAFVDSGTVPAVPAPCCRFWACTAHERGLLPTPTRQVILSIASGSSSRCGAATHRPFVETNQPPNGKQSVIEIEMCGSSVRLRANSTESCSAFKNIMLTVYSSFSHRM